MHPKLKELTSAQIQEELELCEKHKKYFYNNYCRAEGMPEYSEKAFERYLKEAEEKRNICMIKQRRTGFKPNYFQSTELFQDYPLTFKELTIL